MNNNLETKLTEITKNTTIDELIHHRDRFQTFYDLLKIKKGTRKEDLFFYEKNIFLYNNLIYLKQGDNK
jgi:hypothetical protein